jgi:putative tryptophan/tyrosine transport system substrate-binding protein
VPAIYVAASDAQEGGVIAYGTTPRQLDRQVARQLDRNLRGAKPGEMPVQQPSRYAARIAFTQSVIATRR